MCLEINGLASQKPEYLIADKNIVCYKEGYVDKENNIFYPPYYSYKYKLNEHVFNILFSALDDYNEIKKKIMNIVNETNRRIDGELPFADNSLKLKLSLIKSLSNKLINRYTQIKNNYVYWFIHNNTYILLSIKEGC